MVNIGESMNNLSNDNDKNKKELKTKDYILRAKRNYRKKKYSEDKNYREKQLAKNKEWYEKNKDKCKEKRILYMKEYNAKKKLEKQRLQNQKNTPNNDNSIIDTIEKLTINDNKIT
jgi:hypothetical protein